MEDTSDWWRAVSYIVIFRGVVCIIFVGAQWFLGGNTMEWLIMHRRSNQALERTGSHRMKPKPCNIGLAIRERTR